MHNITPHLTPLVNTKPAVSFETAYQHIEVALPTSKFASKGLPVYHPAYGYGFIPVAELNTLFNPATNFVTFKSSSAPIKKLGGSITIGKNVLTVNITHKTYVAYIPLIAKAAQMGMPLKMPTKNYKSEFNIHRSQKIRPRHRQFGHCY